MIRKLICSFAFVLIITYVAVTQSRTLYIGDVELRLGMSREVVMKLLATKYNVSVVDATSFFIKQYDQSKKIYNILGSVQFDNNQLTYIDRPNV